MAKVTREQILLTLLFALVLATRLFFAFSQQGFEQESYFALRQAEAIADTGMPAFSDSLSYSGRTFLFPPLFHYILAGLSLMMPIELAAKILPNIFFSLLVIVVYLIAREITKNKSAALMAAFFSGFVPVMFSTIDSAAPSSLSLLLIFLISYTFIRLNDRGFATLSMIFTVLLLLTEPTIFLFVFSLAAYFLLLIIEKDRPEDKERELAMFLFFLSLWFNILLFKKAFFINGMRVIWENLPTPLLSAYFKEITFLGLLSVIGVVPMLLGVIAVYHAFFKTRNRAAIFFIGSALIAFIMLWFKLIPLTLGLMFLSINLIILSSFAIKKILVDVSKAKAGHSQKVAVFLLIIAFLLTSFAPFLGIRGDDNQYSEDIKALQWLKNSTAQDSVVFGRVEEGFLISYYSGRKNAADSNFLFVKNINQKYKEINSLFSLRLKSEAIRTLGKYSANYVFLSRKTIELEGLQGGLFYADPDCFEKIYDDGAIIYKFLGCRIDE